jgi:hypothetical protein
MNVSTLHGVLLGGCLTDKLIIIMWHDSRLNGGVSHCPPGGSLVLHTGSLAKLCLGPHTQVRLYKCNTIFCLKATPQCELRWYTTSLGLSSHSINVRRWINYNSSFSHVIASSVSALPLPITSELQIFLPWMWIPQKLLWTSTRKHSITFQITTFFIILNWLNGELLWKEWPLWLRKSKNFLSVSATIIFPGKTRQYRVRGYNNTIACLSTFYTERN